MFLAIAMHIQVEDTAASILEGGEEKGEVKRMVDLEVREQALAIVSCVCMRSTLVWKVIHKNWTSANFKFCSVVANWKTLDKYLLVKLEKDAISDFGGGKLVEGGKQLQQIVKNKLHVFYLLTMWFIIVILSSWYKTFII